MLLKRAPFSDIGHSPGDDVTVIFFNWVCCVLAHVPCAARASALPRCAVNQVYVETVGMDQKLERRTL
jgi:hypothetical protein